MQTIKNQLAFISLLTTFLLNLIIVVWVHQSLDKTLQQYLPIEKEIREIKSSISVAHLWLEESLSGDVTIDVEKDILIPFRHKSVHDFLDDKNNFFNENNNYLKELLAIEQELDYLLETVEKRLSDVKKYGTGSDLDQKFDKQFKYVINLINNLSKELYQDIEKELKQRDNNFYLAIGFFLLINILIFYILFRYKKSILTSNKRFEESQQKFISYGQILDNSINEIYIFDANTFKFLYANKGAQNNIGYTLEEMMELTSVDIKPSLSQNDFINILKEITQEGKNSLTFSTLHKRKDGSLYNADIYFQKTSFDGHDAYVSIILDVTHKKEMQNQLLIQSRMAQMGELMSMIAHQWKQPLAAISTTSMNLQLKIELEKFDLDTKQGQEEQNNFFLEKLERINNSIKNLTTTMDDFRNFYKPDKKSINTQLQDITSKAIAIIKSSLNTDNIEIIEQYNENEHIKLYDNELIQVILNILKNAQDNFKNKDIKNKYIKIKTENKIISICDNGGGISTDIIDKIFEPYFSTKDEKNGTGLGLYMSKTIIEDHHNGKLSAENTDDGVCFTVELKSVQ